MVNTMETEKIYDEQGRLVKERIYGATPNGGDYSEACYLDNDMVVIRECTADGELICETWGSK